MNIPPEQRSPIAAALVWVSRITVVALEMVLPGLAGQWLDRKLGTSFLVLVGFAFGLTAGMWHLLVMTGVIKGRKDQEIPHDQEQPPQDDPP